MWVLVLISSGPHDNADVIGLCLMVVCMLVQEKDPDKQRAIAKTFGLSDEDASNLRTIVAEGNFKLEEEAQESNSFF